MSPVEALTQIRALCDEAARGWTYGENTLIPTVRITEIQAVLDAVSVDATPPQGIDRDALLAILMEQWAAGPRETADRILALVRPVEGIVLSREDVILARQGARVLAGLNDRIPGALDPELAERFADLESRLLKASS